MTPRGLLAYIAGLVGLVGGIGLAMLTLLYTHALPPRQRPEVGILLLLIGLSEASHTLREDIENLQLRVGHGLVLIGFFSILDSVPRLIEGLEASKRYDATMFWFNRNRFSGS